LQLSVPKLLHGQEEPVACFYCWWSNATY